MSPSLAMRKEAFGDVQPSHLGQYVNRSNHQSSNASRSSIQSFEGQTMPHNTEDFTGKLPSDLDGNVPPAFSITQKQYLRLVANAMWQEAGKAPGAAKRIAERVECSDKTAQSWLAGETTPANILDLRAMARLPIYAALKRKLAAQEMNLDPRVQQTVQELHKLMQELAGPPQ